ncbi:hypothetical protein ACFT5C_25195 [Streptomyces sp. NPDC057116]|uniref:hypothetical protein n=1 Tax=Streptomyces sp. NPDC057116 TaxID=3346023 RepID=UPI00363DCE20
MRSARRDAPARVVTSALRRAGVPRYLRKAFLEAAPSRLSKDTGALLITYLLLPARGTGGSEAAVDTEGLRADLLGRWSAEGGSAAELLKLIRMMEYRRQALRPSRARGRAEGDGDVAAFSHFWVSSGHDIEELSVFLSDVDHEAVDWFPQ